MKNTITHFVFAITFSIFFGMLISCTDSTTAPSEPLKFPQAGSNYTYQQYETDLGGDTTVTPYFVTDSLLSTEMTFAGRTGVHQFSADGDFDYLTIEDSGFVYRYKGDIEIVPGIVWPEEWINLTNPVSPDTTYEETFAATINQMPGSFTLTHIVTRLGATTVTLAEGESLSAAEVESLFIVVASIDGIGVVSTTVVSTVTTYVPSLRLIAKEVVTTNSDSPFSPIPNGVTVRELVSYDLVTE